MYASNLVKVPRQQCLLCFCTFLLDDSKSLVEELSLPPTGQRVIIMARPSSRNFVW